MGIKMKTIREEESYTTNNITDVFNIFQVYILPSSDLISLPTWKHYSKTSKKLLINTASIAHLEIDLMHLKDK